MSKSLCGKYPCQHLCSRVQYCQAGQERVHWLWLVRSGERGQLSRLPSREVGESKPRAYIRQETRPKSQRAPRFYPTHRAEQSKPLFSRNVRMVSSPVFWLAFLLFIGLVVGIGLALNGGDFTPNQEAPETPAYYEWR